MSPEAPKPGTVAARRAASRGPADARTATKRRPGPSTSSRPTSPPDLTAGPSSAPLADGRDETTEFLLRSLRDLEAEHAAGDITDEDYAALRDDYTARAAVALKAEQRGRRPPAPRKVPLAPIVVVLVIVGVLGFAVLAGWALALAAGERGSGETATGSIDQSPTQAAAECIQLTAQQQMEAAGSTEEVLACYQTVLEEDPDNPVARTYLGWTLYITARQAARDLEQDQLAELYVQAHRQLDLAVDADPGYADARAFQVVLATNEGRYGDAAEHLAAFDDLDAPADMAALVEPLRTQIAEGLEDSSSSSSSTTAPG